MSEPQLHSFNTSRRAHTIPTGDDTHDEDQTIIQNEGAAGVDETQDVDVEDADINPKQMEPCTADNTAAKSNDKEDAGDETTENADQARDQIRPDDNADEVEADITAVDEDAEEEEEQSGTTVLQLSKIKKIFKTDPEHISASEAAVFTTAVATELFIQYLTEQAALVARSEKRKTVQYKDFSAVVSNLDNLNFLGDLVPKTFSLQKLVEEERVRLPKKTNGDNTEEPKSPHKGQKTLNFSRKIIETDSTDVTREATVEAEETPAPAEPIVVEETTQATDEDVVMLDS